jgi:hypothetical protein
MDYDDARDARHDGVFLCHSSDDKPRVRHLFHRLSDDGIECWLDAVSLQPGQDWDLEISMAIRHCRLILVCLSGGSLDRAGYLQKEVRRALDLADEQPDGSTFIIPVRLEPCAVPAKLAQWQAVDIFDEVGYQRLVMAIRAAISDTHRLQGGSSGVLAIDDVIAKNKSNHVRLDIRVRNGGSAVLNLTRATVTIIEREPAAAAYAPSASYNLEITGEHNEIAISHRLAPGEVDGFHLRLGFPPYNTSCFFRARLSIRYNGDMSTTSAPFSFASHFEPGGLRRWFR